MLINYQKKLQVKFLSNWLVDQSTFKTTIIYDVVPLKEE